MKISDLLNDIQTHDLVLPEFQREYVWSRDQAKQLMVSLIRHYPAGSLLFWKTNNPPDLKNINYPPDKLGNVNIILDGQQRLTTLYMLLTGEIPTYYREGDITMDPRDLYFHLGDCDFQYYQATRMKGNSLWWRVEDCFQGDKIQIFKIAKEHAENDAEILKLAEAYMGNLNKLRSVRDMDLPVQTVPIQATIDESIDIFDRVNSQGTKLTDADLALTHITGKWPHARRQMKEKIEELSQQNFFYDLTFMTRALTGVVTQRALFEQIHKSSKEELLAGWQNLTKILDYLITILPGHAEIHSTEDINTTNAFIPIIVYLSLNNKKFPNDRSIKQATHWLYSALMWSRYTAQTDQRLEHDVSLVVRHTNPWTILRSQIEDQRGRIEVKAGDLDGRGAQHPLYRMTYVIAKTHKAVDWFNGALLGKTYGKAYRIHSHHIFPTSVLYENGYDSDNYLHRKLVNEIANRAFLTADSNLSLSNSLPENYFPTVEEKYPGALVKQFIPMNPELWKVNNYEAFLLARRELIAQRINDYMHALIAEPEDTHDRSIAELISLGESTTLEFKSTLQWDVVRNEKNKALRVSVLKTIAAFLNSEGGTLIIGVEDNGAVYGLSRDLQTLSKRTQDGFEQLLNNLIAEYIGVEYGHLIKVRFDQIENEVICAVEVNKAPEPAFMQSDKGKIFYVRHGNTTRSLDLEESYSYIQMNWGF